MASFQTLGPLSVVTAAGTFGLLSALVFGTTACEKLDDTTPLPDGGTQFDAGLTVPPASARGTTGTTGTTGDAGSAPARLRVAHLSPNAPAVSYCVQPKGGSVGGPYFGATGQPGLRYPQLSGYRTLPDVGGSEAEEVTVTIVPQGSPCAGPSLAKTSFPVEAGKATTVAIIGTPEGASPFGLAAIALTDTTVAPAGRVLLRAVHAIVQSDPVSVYLGPIPVAEALAFGKAVGYPYGAGAGYVPIPLGGDGGLAAEGSKLVLSRGVRSTSYGMDSLKAGTAVSVFLVGTLGVGTPSVLSCNDSATPGPDALWECATLSPSP